MKFRRILNLVDQLPRHSRYLAAVVMDEEHVAAIMEAKKDQPKDPHEEATGPTMAAWTLEAEKIAEGNDLLAGVLQVLIAANGGKSKPFKPSARPVTAFAAVKDRKVVGSHRNVLGKVAAARQRKTGSPPVD